MGAYNLDLAVFTKFYFSAKQSRFAIGKVLVIHKYKANKIFQNFPQDLALCT